MDKQQNIISLKLNDLNANPSTSKSNGQTHQQFVTGQQCVRQNESSTDCCESKSYKRFRFRNEKLTNDSVSQHPEQQTQFQYPTRTFHKPHSIAQMKPCRYQANPIFNSSFSEKNYNSSESENSLFDESASDSKLMAYNRMIMQNNSNATINYACAPSNCGHDNRINFLHHFNDHLQTQSNTHSYGGCSNDFNNPNNNAQVTLMPVYQSHSNESLASHQQSYATDYQTYDK